VFVFLKILILWHILANLSIFILPILVIHRLGVAKRNSCAKILHGAYFRTSVLVADKEFALWKLGKHHFLFI